MSAQSLEDKLNARADMEFDAIRSRILGDMRRPTLAFKTGVGRSWKDRDGEVRTFSELADMCGKQLEVFREDYREKFRAEFIAKVEAMQKEMEGYIGALNTHQEGGQ